MSEITILNKKKSGSSIASTLFFAFLLVSTSIILLGSILTISFDIKQQQQLIFINQQFVAQSAAGIVREFVNDKIRILTNTIDLSNIDSFSANDQKVILTRLLKTDSSYRQIAIFNSKREIVSSASRLSFFALDDVTRKIDTKLYADLQKGKMGSYVSNVYIDKVTNEPLMIIAVPIKNVFGDFKGVLVSEVNLKFMWDLVSNLKVGENGTAYVVDQDGYLLAFKNTSKVLKRENLNSISEVSEFTHNNRLGAEQTSKNGKGINGTDVVETYAKVADSPRWAVIVELPIFEAYKIIVQQLIIFGIVIIVTILFAITTSSFFAKKITKPIIQLRDAAKQISAGKLNTTISVSSADEIGELATAFNQMSKQLQESYTDLEKRIQEKTAELAKKIGETERINRFMLGRELKMVELKKENEKLKQELSNKKII